jgi:hypothetical protein
LAPNVKKVGIAEKINNVCLVIALQKDCLMRLPSLDQEINNVARVGTAVHVISKEDLDRTGHRILGSMGINLGKEVDKKIRAAVHVANGVYAHPLGKLRPPPL